MPTFEKDWSSITPKKLLVVLMIFKKDFSPYLALLAFQDKKKKIVVTQKNREKSQFLSLGGQDLASDTFKLYVTQNSLDFTVIHHIWHTS